jgi:hypothetical protein
MFGSDRFGPGANTWIKFPNRGATRYLDSKKTQLLLLDVASEQLAS